MVKKETKETKEVKPVMSPETKKFLSEEEHTEALNAQRHEDNLKAQEEEKKKMEEEAATTQEKWEASQHPKVEKMTLEKYKKILAAYKIQNPVNYAARKDHIEKRLAELK